MKSATSPEVIFEAGVIEFVKRNAAEDEFQRTCALVRNCFPELRIIQAYLQEDPDEDDRWHVVLQITLSPSHPLDLLQAQRRRFSEQLVEQVPPASFPDPVCSLAINFAGEE
jgi:hypothetical protein